VAGAVDSARHRALDLGMATDGIVHVSLSPELGDFVNRLVSSGRYRSESDVLCDGLRLLEQAEERRVLDKWLTEGSLPDEQAVSSERLARARAQIDDKVREGLEALARGEHVDGPEFFAHWRARLSELASREANGVA